MKNNNNRKLIIPVLAAMLVAGAGTGILTYANASHAADVTTQTATGAARQMRAKPAAIGEVTAISGNTITLTSKGFGSTAAVTYTVDATNATIQKMPAMTPPAAGTTPATPRTRPTPTTIAITDVKVGDTLVVEGTANGTSVTATTIMDGVMFGGRGGGMIGGHGAPGMMGGMGTHGTVTAVSGNTVTITETAKDGTTKTYTVDTSSAKLHKTIDISTSDIKVGDTLNVRGKVSGTSVSATDVMDGVMPVPTAPAATN